ncbi:MAG: 30S ribosomal protein S6 [Erysipelotrichaceae bacterium]|jgi:small subunit ribosomal protein S6|nr:30S ribosomal protein S6 [Bacillota bacterium]NLP22777.1 30S ribosomal protein S6 [Erysipelotrichaceae bacterium]HCY06016.1 30S ribosomal protein S6 [Erysipelotrichaceae bacterium]
MRKYEVMYILNSSIEDEKRAELIDSIHAIITDNGGEILKVDEWGMREYAYEINHMTRGYYVVTTYKAGHDAVAEFDRLMRINQSVVRYMNISLEEE